MVQALPRKYVLDHVGYGRLSPGNIQIIPYRLTCSSALTDLGLDVGIGENLEQRTMKVTFGGGRCRTDFVDDDNDDDGDDDDDNDGDDDGDDDDVVTFF